MKFPVIFSGRVTSIFLIFLGIMFLGLLFPILVEGFLQVKKGSITSVVVKGQVSAVKLH